MIILPFALKKRRITEIPKILRAKRFGTYTVPAVRSIMYCTVIGTILLLCLSLAPVSQAAGGSAYDRPGQKLAALTFDDGPGVYTSTLLDTLEQYGAQATFFMLGSNVEKYGADVIPRMAAIGCEIQNGCELGNHSYAHPNMKELSTDDGLAQFQMTDDLIAQYNNGQGATVIRFPYGNSTDELLASIGRPSIMWDVDTLDWQTKNVQANISAVLDSVSPGDIILMHDIHETTVESCATIVPELINRGYELVTIHTLAAANGVDLAAGETYYGFHGGTTNE